MVKSILEVHGTSIFSKEFKQQLPKQKPIRVNPKLKSAWEILSTKPSKKRT